MIRKTLLYSCLLFVFYNLFIILFKPYERIPLKQNQWQGNYIRAQDYIYQPQKYTAVIVGTSLGARMPVDVLPDSIYNLSFSSGSIYTGLEIIKRSPVKPRVIFIETNIVANPPDDKMVRSLFMPGIFTLKAYIPALQEKNQPLLFSGNIEFYNYMIEYAKETITFKIKPLFNKGYKPVFPVRSPGSGAASISPQLARFFSRRLEVYRQIYQRVPPEISLDKLAGYIRYFEAQNTRIVFFEMPVDFQLLHLPAPLHLRRQFQQAFPSIESIPLDTVTHYTTTDGVHMDMPGALAYTHYFCKQAEKHLSTRL